MTTKRDNTPRILEDWNPHDIHAALKKRGVVLDRVGPELGFHRTCGSKALHTRRWPKVKAKIAELLGVAPREIWPSIFDENDQPYSTRRKRHSNASQRARNVCRTADAGQGR
jgi:lambda repressor-like predicted transcriptional regulator